jgi:hypothetical protein
MITFRTPKSTALSSPAVSVQGASADQFRSSRKRLRKTKQLMGRA